MIPAGRWRVEYAAELEVARESAWALDAFATLSTAANSDVNIGGHNQDWDQIRGFYEGVGRPVWLCAGPGAKGTYYLNCKTGQASISAISFKGSDQKTRIRAVCGYL